MKISTVFDPAFRAYGKVLPGYDAGELLRTLETKTPLPEGVEYVPSQPELEELPIFCSLRDSAFGGIPIQLGWCNGRNRTLNCLEYHRSSEVNIGAGDFILLLAKLEEIEHGVLDTARVRAFLAPAGTPVELYATTLHYAPCSPAPGEGFRVAVVLPRGTNFPRPAAAPLPGNEEDRLLWACNKWLLAHGESSEAKEGAVVALAGENITLSADLSV